MKHSGTFYGMVGSSVVMQRLYQRIRRVAPYDIPVLIFGESGTGKELVARAIHAESSRRSGPFYAVNTGALTLELIKSELFGHEKGAFTGATEQKKGFFETANGGTLFLDEIGTMDHSTQVNLLRAIESKEFVRVGGTTSQHTDARIVGATNLNLRKAVESGEFRRDLYYRLNVFSIRLPALRHRTDDIPQLVDYFRQHLDSTYDRDVTGIEPEGMNQLVEYRWPGNVRELLNVMTQLVIGANQPVITAEAVSELLLQSQTGKLPGETPSPEEGYSISSEVKSRSGNDRALVTDDPPPTRSSSSPQSESAVHSTRSPEGTQPDSASFTLLEVGTTIEEAERMLIENTLASVDGNRSKAARTLGISRKSLYNKLKAYDLDS